MAYPARYLGRMAGACLSPHPDRIGSLESEAPLNHYKESRSASLTGRRRAAGALNLLAGFLLKGKGWSACSSVQ
eukprot:1480340-Pleurochrysis_carterae.AAC.7